MADSILRLKVDSQEYDNKLKRAADGLQRYVEGCRKAGGTLTQLDDGVEQFVKELGKMETVSKTAKGSLNEMTKAFTDLKMQYKQLTDEEKASPYGKALNDSLNQLKGRIREAQNDLKSINQELQGGKFGQFGSILDGIGQKMGINANITELLTSKTALMTAGIGAATAVIGKATQEWAKYNAELAKQDQITTVTTGLKGAGADRMTDQARAMVDTYKVDFRETINAANTLMTQFGKSGEEAMSLIRDGMRGMISGDGGKLLSMIQQYAPSFRDAGIEAAQLVAIIQNSEGGIFTDQNMNAIVMGIKNIRLMTDATSKALAKLGIDGEEMTRKLNDGSMTIFEAMQKVSTAINGAGSASQAAGEVMQQVFGRQGAAAGTKLGEAIATLNTNLEETKRQTGELGDAYDDLYEANVKLNGAIRDCFEYDGWDQMATDIKANLVSALASVLDYLGKIKGALGGFSVTQQQGDTRNGGGSFIDRAIARLGDGKSQGQKTIYQKQIGAYANQIFNINDQITELQRKAGEDMDGNMAVNYEKQIRNLEARKEAIKRNMDEYDRRAQAVFAGAVTPPQIYSDINSNTGGKKTGGGKNTTLTAPTYAADSITAQQELVSKLTKQWNEAGAEVRNSYIQPLVEAEAKLKTMKDQQALLKEQAQGRLLGDTKKTTITATVDVDNENALEKLREIEGVTIDSKTLSVTADIQEAIEKLRNIEGVHLNEKTIKINIESQNVDIPIFKPIAGGIPEIGKGLDTLPQHLAPLQQLNKELERLKELLELSPNTEAYQAGLQAIADKEKDINQFKGVSKMGDDAKDTSKSFQQAASAIGQVGSALNGIQDPSAKIVGIVAQAVATIAQGFANATTTSSAGGIFAWIASLAAGSAAMLSAIATIHSATGYANGGVVKGFAGGGTISGNSYSGDNIGGIVDGSQFVGLNAGELVLTRAQTASLAAQLQDKGGSGSLQPYVSGELIFLGANNHTRASGQGEIVTTGMLRNIGLIH